MSLPQWWVSLWKSGTCLHTYLVAIASFFRIATRLYSCECRRRYQYLVKTVAHECQWFVYQIGNCIRQRSVAEVCKLCASRRQPLCLQLPLGWNTQNNGELLLFLSAGSVYLDVCVMGRLGVVGLKLPFRLHNRYRGKANRHPLIIRYWPAMFSSSPWSLQGIKGLSAEVLALSPHNIAVSI